jgi:hypothetical protein
MIAMPLALMISSSIAEISPSFDELLRCDFVKVSTKNSVVSVFADALDALEDLSSKSWNALISFTMKLTS